MSNASNARGEIDNETIRTQMGRVNPTAADRMGAQVAAAAQQQRIEQAQRVLEDPRVLMASWWRTADPGWARAMGLW